MPLMRRLLPSLSLVLAPLAPLAAQANAPIIGRWDLTCDCEWGKAPAWLEVSLSGRQTLVGRYLATGGSARPISKIDFDGKRLRFAIPGQWDADTGTLVVEATYENEQLAGTWRWRTEQPTKFTGVRAPALRRTTAPVWDAPITLFDGTSMAAWTPLPGESRWSVVNGILTNARSGANLRTKQEFEDFKLHVEFRVPKGGNSGVYLRGRYEVQVEDTPPREPKSVDVGGVYGLLVPNEYVATGPGTWQTFDITLIGRRVTIVHNGKAVIVDQTIPGITGGALDSKEEAPGPIYLQGDHTGVEYRNIVITPARRAR
jgi:hypothetical protein